MYNGGKRNSICHYCYHLFPLIIVIVHYKKTEQYLRNILTVWHRGVDSTLILIRKIKGSNLGPDAVYHVWVFLCFSSVFPDIWLFLLYILSFVITSLYEWTISYRLGCCQHSFDTWISSETLWRGNVATLKYKRVDSFYHLVLKSTHNISGQILW